MIRHPMTVMDPEYSPEEVEFLVAMDRYKRQNQRPCPTWREVREVFLALGYRKVGKRSQMPVFNRKKVGTKRSRS